VVRFHVSFPPIFDVQIDSQLLRKPEALSCKNGN
jgi:hypothetical protein